MTPAEAMEMLLAGDPSGPDMLRNKVLNRHLRDFGHELGWFTWAYPPEAEEQEAWCYLCARYVTKADPPRRRVQPLIEHRIHHINQLIEGELHVPDQLTPPAR